MWMYVLAFVVLFYVVRWFRELQRVPDRGLKYVYITGCDSGFGNLLARHLDKCGFNVVAACFTEKGEEELKKSCSSRVSTISLDVRKPESINKAAEFIKNLVGNKGLWAVVNNAGVSVPSGPCDWLTLQDYKSMHDVNLDGVIAVTLSVIPLIKKARGRVVNVASVFGRIAPFGGPYSVSKYGVEAFNDSLRRSLYHFGVKVLCIEPGFFKTSVTDTDLLIRNVQMLWNRLPKETKDEYGDNYMSQDVVRMKLCDNSTVSNRTNQKLDQMCFEHTNFTYRLQCEHGCIVGFTSFTFFANLYMEEVEKKALIFYSRTPPSHWFKYASITWVNTKSKEPPYFTDHVKSMDKRIRFTWEDVRNNRFTFLNCEVLTGDGNSDIFCVP